MFRRALVAVVATTAIVATASPASARPVQDEPIYCTPGYQQAGAHCEPVRRLTTDEESLGEWALAVFGVLALLAVS